MNQKVERNDIVLFCSRVNRSTISYRSVFSVLLSVNRKTDPVYVHFRDLFRLHGDTKLVSMTTSDAEVEIRPNCISLILTIVSSF